MLIRAVEPIEVTAKMRGARPKVRRDVDIANDPGKLCQALGIDRSHDRLDLMGAQPSVRLELTHFAEPGEIVVSTRIGLSVAQETPWR